MTIETCFNNILQFSKMLVVNGPIDPIRDIDTLNEEDMDSEFIEDSEYEGSEQPSLAFEHSTSIPILNSLDSGSEDYRFSTGKKTVKISSTQNSLIICHRFINNIELSSNFNYYIADASCQILFEHIAESKLSKIIVFFFVIAKFNLPI